MEEERKDEAGIDQNVIEFVRALARVAARAARKCDIDLDVDDPRVVRWMILTTLDGLMSAQSSPERIREAAKATHPDERYDRSENADPHPGVKYFITWEHLVAHAAFKSEHRKQRKKK